MQFPDFNSVTTLEQHIKQTLAFYHPKAFDENGGFFQHFRDDGSIYDWYQRIWEYSWEHMVDHEYGACYEVLRSSSTET